MSILCILLKSIKVKKLEAINHFILIIGILDNRSINWLFSESAQHYRYI